ncbi:hypothetical protein G3O00_40175 [Burkholderia sp. Ac-20384]|uniref:hypothetical protein n=1 Tax=Burkholderia sp. Ac-20384 TaxID=2703902 RepID=UPI00197E9194|nr:hypothetical protein [Burkholderia sp. Ac-20384]MBN3829749.1 hypothetical protein [Burkholderia sp. Ac-20384]
MRKSGTHGRRPLSKAQLLPLPTDQVRRLSLKHHLALVCLADGRGDVDTLSTLANVVELAHQLGAGDGVIIRPAQDAIAACVDRAEQTAKIGITEVERAAIAAVLVYHDAQLARVPLYRYAEALEQAAGQARRAAGVNHR